MQGIIAPPLYAAGTHYYAELLRYGNVCFDINSPIEKSWGINRTRIIGANGLQTLTIPLIKPEKGIATPLRELCISSHGNWQRIHWGAIYSAYGKAPFFEHLEPDLRHIYENNSRWLVDFNMALHQCFVDFASLPINTTPHNEGYAISRNLAAKPTEGSSTPYYQLWATRYGFIPNLSIIDLLMNEGTLAPVILGISR